MKKLTLILTIFSLSVILWSCGGDKSDKTTSEQTEKTDNATTKIFSNKYLSVELTGNWTISKYGASNDEKYSLFSFKEENTSNIYDAFNKDFEQIGDITETTVDGMPAVTRIQKFMQNEMKTSRVWLIYDGVNIISFNVAAPEKIFDDEIAKSIVSKVKILNKGQNVELPTKEKSEFVKPTEFPEQTLNDLKDVLIEDSFLSKTIIQNALKTFTALQDYDTLKVQDLNKEARMTIADSAANANEFSNINEVFNKVLKPSLTCATVLSMIEKDNSQNKINSIFLKDFLSQNKLSYADLKCTYENWDLIMELYSKTKK